MLWRKKQEPAPPVLERKETVFSNIGYAFVNSAYASIELRKITVLPFPAPPVADEAETPSFRQLRNFPKVNLIAPNNLSEENLDALHTELREILRYIKHSGNAQDLLETVMGNEAFASMSRRAVEVINATTNSKLPLPRGEEMVNVCKAIEDIKKEEREEGRRDSTIEHTRKLMESQHWSAEEAMKAMGIPQSDFAEYLPLLQ